MAQKTAFQKICNIIAMILTIIGIMLIFCGIWEAIIVIIMSGGKVNFVTPELIAGIVCIASAVALVVVKKALQKNPPSKKRKKS